MARSIKNPCAICTKSVRTNQKRMHCGSCKAWIHCSCCCMDISEYNRLAKTNEVWFCRACLSDMFAFNGIEDDTEFRSCLFTLGHFDAINTCFIHNVAQLNIINDMIIVNRDIDPDYNGLVRLQPNRYLMPEEFNNCVEKNKLSDNTFSIMHINARSLVNKLDDFVNFIGGLSLVFNIVAVTETWATDSTEQHLRIPNYKYCEKHRSSSRGGGVAIYIQEDINYVVRQDLDMYCCDEFEFICIQIEDQTGGKIIACVYRPPNSNLSCFNESYSKLLDKLMSEKHEIYIAGDFNVNLLSHETHIESGNFLNTVIEHSQFPTIVKPTRFGKTSTTLIDNIFTNSINNDYTAGLIITDLSDHLPVFYITQNKSPGTKKGQISYTYRDYSDAAIWRFYGVLHNVEWSQLQLCCDASECYQKFIDIFDPLYNDCFPVKHRVQRVIRNYMKPWISAGIQNSIRTKNRLYKAWIACRSDDACSIYKCYKNKLTHVIRTAKNSYYVNKFSEIKLDMKKTWGLIKTVLNNNVQPEEVHKLKINNNVVTDTQTVANCFNEYFANVGQDLGKKIPSCVGNCTDNITQNYSIAESMFVKPTNELEIMNIIHSLQATKSPGYDCYSPKVIKMAVETIAVPLTIVFNCSLRTSVFPDGLKIAKVRPVYKAGDKLMMSNYRPISVLSVFSKILERLMFNRISAFLNCHNVLADNQYGFRDNRTTSLALLDLVDKIANKLEEKYLSVGIFMDLSKAFDTVNHDILLKKLNLYGVRGNANNWIRNYLENRLQFVQIQNSLSCMMPITCGVPQGSVLGPLLFLIYINDIIHVSKVAEIILFADDTSLFFSDTDVNGLCDTINQELDKVATWFKLNKLSLNIKKTNFILFKTRNSKNLYDLKLSIDGIDIDRVIKTKFLGVIVNETLTWTDHIRMVKQKVSKSIGIIAHMRYVLPFSIMVSLYHALIEPYLLYCNIVWAAQRTEELNGLFLLQKKSVRIITCSHWLSHTAPLFMKCNILSVTEINSLQLGCFMYCATRNVLPNYFCTMFVKNSDVHLHDTRQKDNIHLSKFKTNKCKYIGRVLGPRLWNSIPADIRASPTLQLFRNRYRAWILLAVT